MEILLLDYRLVSTITSGSGNVMIGNLQQAESNTGNRQLKIGTFDGSTSTTWISGDSSGNITVPAGIHIGGTGDANKLDDYEEGTWTPGLTIASSGNSGTYTKIGNLVFARFKVIPTASGSNIRITGLPIYFYWSNYWRTTRWFKRNRNFRKILFL